MRTFILYSRKGVTSSNFSLEDLPSSGGRMDLVCRCVTSAMWVSQKLREDTRIFVVLNGLPKPPVTILFSPEMERVTVDERSVAIWVKKALNKVGAEGWHSLDNGIRVARKSFEEVLKGIKGRSPVYVLEESGKNIDKVRMEENPIFILGDNVGLPTNEEKLALKYGEKISLGSTSYLSSSCISVVQWMCDRAKV